MKTLHLKTKSISRPALRLGSLFVALALACFALSPAAYAQCPSQCDIRGNTATGNSALQSNTTGAGNTATGASALQNNTTGTDNTATGDGALFSNTTGTSNIATGVNALEVNTTGSNNTATGYGALFDNNADNNTATGFDALLSNTTGPDNTATGASALQSNKTGGFNTANGVDALNSNTTGSLNTASGVSALGGNTTGNNNTASGEGALAANKTGSNNTATGLSALQSNTAGSNNTADGVEALAINTGNSNTGSGYFALINNTSGSNNIAVGANAGFNLTTGSNNIDVGNKGVAGESAKIRVGTVGTQKAVFIAGIHGVAVTGTAVVVSASGQLGVAPSSARFKEGIRPMDKTSETILALKPVTFRYKEELDSDKIPQFGLVAEEVEKVNPDLVARDEDGKIMSVRYDAVNAMLLNEFLKEHRKVAELEKQIEALTAAVQKVSDRQQPGKAATQVTANKYRRPPVHRRI